MPIPLKALEAKARDLGKTIAGVMPPGVGFMLMMFDFGDGGNMTYISNGQRADCIKAVEEWLERVRAEQS